jgi:two-component system, OmpR family, response regulator ArlR
MGNESRKKSILVIDDDERVLTALECFLENEGYETTTAWSGREGMDLLRLRKFDLVLLDDYLWDMDAEAILQEIRKMAIQPLVMLTESAPTPDGLKRYFELGAHSLVGKWASCDEIAATVRECFARKALEKVFV